MNDHKKQSRKTALSFTGSRSSAASVGSDPTTSPEPTMPYSAPPTTFWNRIKRTKSKASDSSGSLSLPQQPTNADTSVQSTTTTTTMAMSAQELSVRLAKEAASVAFALSKKSAQTEGGAGASPRSGSVMQTCGRAAKALDQQQKAARGSGTERTTAAAAAATAGREEAVAKSDEDLLLGDYDYDDYDDGWTWLSRHGTTATDGGDSGCTSDWPRSASGQSRSTLSRPQRRSEVGYKVLLRAKGRTMQQRRRRQQQQQQQQHLHHHYHRDHHHRRRHSTGDLLSDSTTIGTAAGFTPPSDPARSPISPPGPNVYHHHHHHHHYHHHYYHFRGRSVDRPLGQRPVSYPPQLTLEALSVNEKDYKCESNDNDSILTTNYLDSPSIKTPRTLHKIKGIFKIGKSKKKDRLSTDEDGFNKYRDFVDTVNAVDNNSKHEVDEYANDQPQYEQEYVMHEFVRTEKKYIEDLSLVVNGYMALIADPATVNCYVPVPDDLKINSAIFVNFKTIYEWHKNEFLPTLERCLADPNEFKELLKKLEFTLALYTKYSQKIPRFEYTIYEHKNYFEEMRKFLVHDIQISSILIKPLQRITQYNELLKKMLKCAKRAKFQNKIELLQKTIDDLNQFIRDVEEIITPNQESNTVVHTTPMNTVDSAQIIEKALKHREFALRELVTTEEKYVRDLGLVVEGYMAVMDNPKAHNCDIPIPADLQSNSIMYRLVFGNIRRIYEWHRDKCLPAVEQCLTRPQALQDLFRKFDDIMHLYATYCQKKYISESLVNTHENYFETMRQFLGHNMVMSSLMIKPVQRITKYNLLLTEIIKYTKKAEMHDQIEPIQNAFDTMSKLMEKLDEIMIIDRLYDFDYEINSQGDLLLHGMLRCAERHHGNSQTKMSYKDFYVFLFEKIMIFTDQVANKIKSRGPLYFYKDHILLNKMELEDQLNSTDGSFVIRSTDESRMPMQRYICRPVSLDCRFKWFEKLQQLQDSQSAFLDILTNPLGNTK